MKNEFIDRWRSRPKYISGCRSIDDFILFLPCNFTL